MQPTTNPARPAITAVVTSGECHPHTVALTVDGETYSIDVTGESDDWELPDAVYDAGIEQRAFDVIADVCVKYDDGAEVSAAERRWHAAHARAARGWR